MIACGGREAGARVRKEIRALAFFAVLRLLILQRLIMEVTVKI